MSFRPALRQVQQRYTTSDKKALHNSVTVFIPSGAGELVQGQLASGEDFLVTNPIECFSEVRVNMSVGEGMVNVSPHTCDKAKQAAIAAISLFNAFHLNFDISINSDIPVGKGMASSTADVVGVVEAIALVLDKHITPEQISDIAVSIEPSDGLMYHGVVVYNHRQGQLLEYLGPAPLMRQLIVDLGGGIDTIDFNKKSKNYTDEEIAIQSHALSLIREGIKASDLAKIGLATTLSARINQRLLPKPELETIIKIAFNYGAYGVVCAHSGTILSLPFDPDNLVGSKQAKAALRERHDVCLDTYSVRSW